MFTFLKQPYHYRSFYFFLLLVPAFALSVHMRAPAADHRPNVVVIMMDDFGAELVGSYGSEMYETPNIDQLAKSGIRFSNAYTPPLCTPTRVQIMSGQYPFRNGWKDGIWKEDHQYIKPKTIPMGLIFQQAGYATAAAGKYQLARFDEHPKHPENVGFPVHSFWSYDINLDEFDNTDEIKNRPSRPSRYWNPAVWQDGRLLRNVNGKYGPDIYNQRLLTFIENHRDQPFMVYYPMNLTHIPRHDPPAVETSGNEWGDLNQFQKMVKYTDVLIGRLMKKLVEQNLRKETLVIVTGDNGTPFQVTSKFKGKSIKGGKKQLNEAGTRVPFIANWPGTIPAGQVSDAPIDTSDVLPTITAAAGIDLPQDYTVDGRNFLPHFKGKTEGPRDWVFVQLREKWFIRSKDYRVHHDGRFYHMSDRYDPEQLTSPLDQQQKQIKKTLLYEARKLMKSSNE